MPSLLGMKSLGRPGLLNADFELSDEVANVVNQQLIDLGYIEDNRGHKERAVKRTLNESNLNLARAYLDGGMVDAAIPLFEQLGRENPNDPRYPFRLATCYQMKGELTKTRELVATMREQEFFDKNTLGFH